MSYLSALITRLGSLIPWFWEAPSRLVMITVVAAAVYATLLAGAARPAASSALVLAIMLVGLTLVVRRVLPPRQKAEALSRRRTRRTP